LDVWREPDGVLTVVDGHTRLSVAKELGIEEVPVEVYGFPDELAALEHALHKQRDRRNLSGYALVRVIRLVDEEYRKPRGGIGANQYTVDADRSRDRSASHSQGSAVETARIVGTSPATVVRARAVYDDPQAVEEVESGVSIHVAADRAGERKGTKLGLRKRPAGEPGNGRAPGGGGTAWRAYEDLARRPRVDDEPMRFGQS
jgi:ParB-like chromosome segregation protein Spo0J